MNSSNNSPLKETNASPALDRVSNCVPKTLLSIREKSKCKKLTLCITSRVHPNISDLASQPDQNASSPSVPSSDHLIREEHKPEDILIAEKNTSILNNILEPIDGVDSIENHSVLEPEDKEVSPGFASQIITQMEGKGLFHPMDNESLKTEPVTPLLPIFYKQGYLMKKTSRFFGWERHYFEVQSLKIYYAQSEEELDSKVNARCINLLATPCKITDHKGQDFSISISGSSYVLALRANNIDEANEWTDFLKILFAYANECHPRSQKYALSMDILDKADVLGEEEFLASIDTGDILLLKSNHFAAKMQRLFTSSGYDHLALLVRAQDDIYVYDSTIDNGVQLTNWADFKKSGLYSTVTYRKIHIPDNHLNDQIKEKLWEFVTLHLGKKYDLSIGKLFRKASYSDNDNTQVTSPKTATKAQKIGKSDISTSSQYSDTKDSSHLNTSKNSVSPLVYRNTEEGFFCSELVAAAYKAVGLLDASISSTRYLPVSFSQKKDLTMLHGSYLSYEYGIALIKGD